VILVGGGLPVADGATPLVLRLAPDGTPDDTFDGNGAWDAARDAAARLGARRAARGRRLGDVRRRRGARGLVPERARGRAADGGRRSGPGVRRRRRHLEAVLNRAPGPGRAARWGSSAARRAVVLAGTVNAPRQPAEGAVVRMLPDGSLDPRFGRTGVTRLTARRGLRVSALARHATGA
jgi:hypothetical protein